MSPSTKYSSRLKRGRLSRAVLAVLRVVDVAVELQVADDEPAPARAELQRAARPRRESPPAAGRAAAARPCRRARASRGDRRRRTRAGARRPGSRLTRSTARSGPFSSWFSVARPVARGPTAISALTASAPSRSRQAKLASRRGATHLDVALDGEVVRGGAAARTAAARRRSCSTSRPALPCGRRGSSAGR